MSKFWSYIVVVSLAYSAIYVVVTNLMKLKISLMYEHLFVVTMLIVVIDGVVKAIINK
ncbi:hypothetical protein GCM10007416_34550 [Kroppenstedtia guangzhouensis]|jgi:hypothetical protein|uniref:Uncharacterized protein n=1 Tax=Kroppenstedtia guangzhouensis TaxID=1274356 RepID=A0ABQ1H4D7_9BACL|nr:hypothetical protein GCM10007416_34550 [Kroppenstedtia guangzhouensis]